MSARRLAFLPAVPNTLPCEWSAAADLTSDNWGSLENITSLQAFTQVNIVLLYQYHSPICECYCGISLRLDHMRRLHYKNYQQDIKIYIYFILLKLYIFLGIKYFDIQGVVFL